MGEWRNQTRHGGSDVWFGPKVGEMGSKWDKLDTFSIYTENWSENIPDLSHLAANLTYFVTISDSPVDMAS